MKINKETYEKYLEVFDQGELIFNEGDSGDAMYVVIDGEVEIRKATSSSSTKTLISLHSGDIFGEMALIEQKSRSASAVAVKSTKALVLNQNLFESFIDTNPDFARKMIRVLSERLRKANSIIHNIMATNRYSQILNGLNFYAQNHGITTFKGARINIQEFTDWATTRLGIPEKEIQTTVQTLLKRNIVKSSALGKNEILVEIIKRKPV